MAKRFRRQGHYQGDRRLKRSVLLFVDRGVRRIAKNGDLHQTFQNLEQRRKKPDVVFRLSHEKVFKKPHQVDKVRQR